MQTRFLHIFSLTFSSLNVITYADIHSLFSLPALFELFLLLALCGYFDIQAILDLLLPGLRSIELALSRSR